MKSVYKLGALALALGVAAPTYAVVVFDQNVTPGVIFGTGVANGAFTVDQGTGVEVGLRGKLRHNAAGAPENTFNSNGDGTYSFSAGVAPTQAFPTAVWSFEWSINSNFTSNGIGSVLNEYLFQLGVDSDASQGTNFTIFDPVNGDNPADGTKCWDHATGTNTTTAATAQVADCSAGNANRLTEYASLLANNHVAQNSWQPHLFLTNFDPTVDGTYNFFLTASDGSGNLLARTDIQIIVGAGGTAVVPEPGSLALVALALTGLGLTSRRRRKG